MDSWSLSGQFMGIIFLISQRLQGFLTICACVFFPLSRCQVNRDWKCVDESRTMCVWLRFHWPAGRRRGGRRLQSVSVKCGADFTLQPGIITSPTLLFGNNPAGFVFSLFWRFFIFLFSLRFIKNIPSQSECVRPAPRDIPPKTRSTPEATLVVDLVSVQKVPTTKQPTEANHLKVPRTAVTSQVNEEQPNCEPAMTEQVSPQSCCLDTSTVTDLSLVLQVLELCKMKCFVKKKI